MSEKGRHSHWTLFRALRGRFEREREREQAVEAWAWGYGRKLL